jgi:hypothetical protein
VLSKVQAEVLEKLKSGSVIGELSDKTNGLYELFTKKSNFVKSRHFNHVPFTVRRLNKNTVFALLTVGTIRIDNSIGAEMKPFSRDCWYVYNSGKAGE